MESLLDQLWPYLPWIIVALVLFQVLRGLWRFGRWGLARLNPLPEQAAQTSWQIQELLQQQLNFTAEDLESNRTFQQASLRQRLRLLPGILFNLGSAAFWAFLLVQFVGRTLFTDQSSGILNFLGENLFFLVFLGAAVLPLLYRAGVATAELVLGRLASAEGPLSKQTGRQGRRKTYQIFIEGTVYEVNQQAYQALPEGHRYRAYYFPYSKKLASLELLQLQRPEISITDASAGSPDPYSADSSQAS